MRVATKRGTTVYGDIDVIPTLLTHLSWHLTGPNLSFNAHTLQLNVRELLFVSSSGDTRVGVSLFYLQVRMVTEIWYYYLIY